MMPGRAIHAAEGHSYQMLTRKADAPYVGPDEWLKLAPRHKGSWWPEWARFLADHSSDAIAAPLFDAEDAHGLGDAPSHYVLQR